MRRSTSTTTRPPRDGEVDGESYYFVSEKDFEALKSGSLIEFARVHGHWYGTPRRFVEETLRQGKDVVLSIDVQGGAQVKKSFADAVFVFILPPSSAVLLERITRRGTDYAGEIRKRLSAAQEEIRHASAYDYMVINDKLEDAVSALSSIIQSERQRRDRYEPGFLERFSEPGRKKT